jgi:hypothetical protein
MTGREQDRAETPAPTGARAEPSAEERARGAPEREAPPLEGLPAGEAQRRGGEVGERAAGTRAAELEGGAPGPGEGEER